MKKLALLRVTMSYVIVTFIALGIWSCQKCSKDEFKFSGSVFTADSMGIDKAWVRINDASVKTDNKGRFKVCIPNNKRYVITISKPGYSIISRVVSKLDNTAKFELSKVKTVEVDPTKRISVTDDMIHPRTTLKLDNPSNKIASTPFVYNSKGKLIGFGWPAQLKENIQNYNSVTSPVAGFNVSIPANSLVGKNGNPPNGKVKIAVSTLDVFSPNVMPGDFTATSGERLGYMETRGAGTTTIFDGEEIFQLKKGAKAIISIPVDPSFLLSRTVPPDSIPFLYYNEHSGIWEQDGYGKYDQKINKYLAETSHFSAFNMDLFKMNPSCVSFDFEASFPESRVVVEAYTSASYHPQFGVYLSGVSNMNFKSSDCSTNNKLFRIKNIPNNSPIALVVKLHSGGLLDPNLISSYGIVNNIAVVYTDGPVTSGYGPMNEPPQCNEGLLCQVVPTFMATPSPLYLAGCSKDLGGSNFEINLSWAYEFQSPASSGNKFEIFKLLSPSSTNCNAETFLATPDFTISTGLTSIIYNQVVSTTAAPGETYCFKITVTDGAATHDAYLFLEVGTICI